MSKFRHHKYTWSKPFASPRHNWELVGPEGAIHFHVSLTPGYEPSCGLEGWEKLTAALQTGSKNDG